MGSIFGSGRSHGGGHGNPLQYSCLENSMDRAWQSTFHKGCKELNETEHTFNFGFPGSSAVKNPPAMQEMQAGDWFDPWVRKIPWRKKMATYSSILAWKTPRTEEPGGLQFVGLQRAEHDCMSAHTHSRIYHSTGQGTQDTVMTYRERVYRICHLRHVLANS